MTDPQKAIIRAFVENKQMFVAVRHVLLSGMLGDKFDSTNWVWRIDSKLSDAEYGKQVKITREAIEWINAGFQEMQRIVPSNPQAAPINEAR